MAKTVNSIEEASVKESVLEKIKSVKPNLAMYGIRGIVTKNGLSPYIGPQILEEVQYA
ncbi:hypothetical protein [Proteiniphilum sp. X52]|uniref:hypothetical protein n=1 Tax=Proteiniphilum sp. X52 TaxID=2382159 RepID=UPI00162841A1|nr:hypothetical protein [Proteiniphilum sp. X52]